MDTPPPPPSVADRPQPVSLASARWFYSQDGAVIGPMPLASLKALWNAGELPTGTLAVQEGREDWQALADVLGAVSEPSKAPSSPLAGRIPPPPLPQRAEKTPLPATKRAMGVKQWFLLAALVPLLGILMWVLSLPRDSSSDASPRQRHKTETEDSASLPHKHVTKAGYLASPSREVVEQAIGYVVANDPEALNKLLETGTVFNLKGGMAVEIVESSLLSGMVKIRPRGEVVELWTNIEAVK